MKQKSLNLKTLPSMLGGQKTRHLVLVSSLTTLLAACGSSGSDPVSTATPAPTATPTPAPVVSNDAPTATAAAMPVALKVGYPQTVTLSATGSNDPENDALSYAWTQTAGSSVTLVGADSENATFDMPTTTEAETLTFNLAVTDSADNTSTTTVTVDVPAGNASNCPPATGNLTAVPLVSGEAQRNNCQISGVLTEDATLENGYHWYLEGMLRVGSSSASPTLTIDAGTSIYGDNVDAVDYLEVYPGASILADGSRAQPIKFSSDDAGYSGTGEWGGIYIKGNGDQQGTNWLDYTVVAEAGALVTVDKSGSDSSIYGGGSSYGGDSASSTVTYNDSIVIDGADDGTRLTFVQSHDSARDGIRLTNTTARLSWILVTGAERDGIWYRDYNGLIKDLMVIHRPDSGRSGIYAAASAQTAGLSNPRIVNATLVGRDNSSESAANDATAREFGILFADNITQARYGNILIANFRNGCYEVEPTADLSSVGYVDGIHCANEAGANGNFNVVREGGTDLTNVGIGNGDGVRYYNGVSAPITFTGETAARNFTAGWYLGTIGSLTNGLAADANALNGFMDGDTNGDGTVDSNDIGASPILGVAGPALVNPVGNNTGFNHDVGSTGGYDLTHIGAVRSGADANAGQFNDWTVATGEGEGFAVPAP